MEITDRPPIGVFRDSEDHDVVNLFLAGENGSRGVSFKAGDMTEFLHRVAASLIVDQLSPSLPVAGGE